MNRKTAAALAAAYVLIIGGALAATFALTGCHTFWGDGGDEDRPAALEAPEQCPETKDKEDCDGVGKTGDH